MMAVHVHRQPDKLSGSERADAREGFARLCALVDQLQAEIWHAMATKDLDWLNVCNMIIISENVVTLRHRLIQSVHKYRW